MVTGCNQSEGKVGGRGVSVPRTAQSRSTGCLLLCTTFTQLVRLSQDQRLLARLPALARNQNERGGRCLVRGGGWAGPSTWGSYYN